MNLPLLARRITAACVITLALHAPALRAEDPVDWTKVTARTAPAWVQGAVVYEIFPRQFSAKGNFEGIIERLDELKKLGVDVLWLMPIHPVGRLKAKGSIGSPYAVRDYYAVNPDYGTKDDLHRLIDGAHQRGMKVIIDIVANHTSWDSVMMSTPALYKQDGDGHVIPPHPDWADVAGLNYKNPDTHRYMRDMLKYWAREFNLDGFRCDAAGEVPTNFWEEVRSDVDQIRPGFLMLAEASKPELMVRAFDMDYGWPLMASLNAVMMEGAPASAIRSTWEGNEKRDFPVGTLHMHCSDNHDEARAVSRYGWKGALAASALMFTLDGVPLIYNGMEVGDATESGDPALFEHVPILWEPKQREHFRATYQALVALRHAHAALQSGEVVWLENGAPQNVISFLRRSQTEEFVTLVNVANRPQAVAVEVDHPSEFTLVLGSETKSERAVAGLPTAVLGANEWRIYRRVVRP